MWSHKVLCCRACSDIALVHYRQVTEVCYYLANSCLCGYARHIVVVVVGGGGAAAATIKFSFMMCNILQNWVLLWSSNLPYEHYNDVVAFCFMVYRTKICLAYIIMIHVLFKMDEPW